MCSIMFAIKVFCESLSYDRNANVWISASLIALCFTHQCYYRRLLFYETTLLLDEHHTVP